MNSAPTTEATAPTTNSAAYFCVGVGQSLVRALGVMDPVELVDLALQLLGVRQGINAAPSPSGPSQPPLSAD